MTKEKTYFVICIRETDSDPEILHLTGQSVRDLAKILGQESIAICEGNLIKGFDSKIDLGKL